MMLAFQEVGTIKWPANLEEVTFGVTFDRDVEGTVWPGGLRRLVFGARFNRDVEGVVWPAGLEQVSDGTLFVWSPSLIWRGRSGGISVVGWPCGLEHLYMGRGGCLVCLRAV